MNITCDLVKGYIKDNPIKHFRKTFTTVEEHANSYNFGVCDLLNKYLPTKHTKHVILGQHCTVSIRDGIYRLQFKNACFNLY